MGRLKAVLDLTRGDIGDYPPLPTRSPVTRTTEDRLSRIYPPFEAEHWRLSL